MAIITVPKTHAVSALDLYSFTAVESKLLPMVQTNSQFAVSKIVEGNPALIEGNYYGLVKENWENGKYNVNSLGAGQMTFIEALLNYDPNGFTITNPTFRYDNTVTRKTKGKITFPSQIFIWYFETVDPLTLEIIRNEYNSFMRDRVTVAGITVDCRWGKILDGSTSDFILTPNPYYLSSATSSFSKVSSKVIPTFNDVDDSFNFLPTLTPQEFSHLTPCTLPMGKEYKDLYTIVEVSEITTDTVPENSDPYTIYLSPFRNEDGKIVDQSLCCSGWGNRQENILYPSWVDPVIDAPYAFIDGTGQTVKGFSMIDKTDSFGRSDYYFEVLAQVLFEAEVSRPVIGITKYDLNVDNEKYAPVKFTIGSDYTNLQSQIFQVIAQDSNSGNIYLTGRLPNLNYFDCVLNLSDGKLNLSSFNYRNDIQSIFELTDISQIGYSFIPSTSSIPVDAVEEKPYSLYPFTGDVYKLIDMPTSSTAKTLVENSWGRSIIWSTSSPSKMYALFKDGSGYIEIDLSILNIPVGFSPYAFKRFDNLYLLVWKSDVGEIYIHKIVFLAIWLESDVINVDYEKVVYNPLICYAPTLQKGSPLTKVK